MSQFSLRVVAWIVVITLLLVGAFLQVISARGATLAGHPSIAAGAPSASPPFRRF
ncbi:MAG TPA: hypothetical protein VJM79_00485 [Rhizorhapis sp.]|nr:hypothetical protein [Rhizorhapis sp.]